MPANAIRVIISGRVQGVCYRAWTTATARGMNLSGWVRNRQDGAVEAVFCGEDGDIERMLAACRVGPPAARVTNIERFDCDETQHQGFMTKPTA